MKCTSKCTVISVVLKFTEGHSSRKRCLSQASLLIPVNLRFGRPVLEEIKCEENMVYIVSLGPAKTAQQNHFSKKTQTKR